MTSLRQMAHPLRNGLLGLLLSLLATGGCVSTAGLASFKSYAQAFDQASAVSSSIFDELAVVERKVAKEDFFAQGEFMAQPTRVVKRQVPVAADAGNAQTPPEPGVVRVTRTQTELTAEVEEEKIENRRNTQGIIPMLGFDPEFYVEDARWVSDIGDPPVTATYRRCMAVVAAFNQVVLAYADGQMVGELKTHASVLGGEVGALAGILSSGGATTVVSGLSPLGPAVKILGELVEGLANAASRAAFRRSVVEQQPQIDRILVAIRDSAPSIFSLLTAEARVAARRGDSSAREKIEAYRRLLSDWVIGLDDTRAALAATVSAIEAPRSDLALMMDVNRSAQELRMRTERIRTLLAEMRHGAAR